MQLTPTLRCEHFLLFVKISFSLLSSAHEMKIDQSSKPSKFNYCVFIIKLKITIASFRLLYFPF